MATKNKVAGLHLWNVRVTYMSQRNRLSTGLWITTANESIPQAMGKVGTFLHNNRADFQKAKVRQIEYQGTIDA